MRYLINPFGFVLALILIKEAPVDHTQIEVRFSFLDLTPLLSNCLLNAFVVYKIYSLVTNSVNRPCLFMGETTVVTRVLNHIIERSC